MKSITLPEYIQGETIHLKKHSFDNAEIMFEYVEKDRERLREFLPWVDATKSIEDEINFIKFTHSSWENKTCFEYGIYINNGEYIGNIGLHTINWNNSCGEIGYWIFKDYEGQGFISEAVLILEKVFFGLGLNRLEIRCASQNIRSKNVPLNNGYDFEGTLKKNMVNNGKYVDTLVFAKLKQEVLKKYPEIINTRIDNKKIYIRKPIPEEYFYIQWLWNDKESTKEIGGPFPKTIQEIDFLLNNQKSPQLYYLIFKKGTDEIIGEVSSARFCNKEKKSEFNIKIANKHINKGFGKMAMDLFLENYFNKYPDYKMIDNIGINNKKSQDLFIKYGFRHTKTMKDAFWVEMNKIDFETKKKNYD